MDQGPILSSSTYLSRPSSTQRLTNAGESFPWMLAILLTKARSPRLRWTAATTGRPRLSASTIATRASGAVAESNTITGL